MLIELLTKGELIVRNKAKQRFTLSYQFNPQFTLFVIILELINPTILLDSSVEVLDIDFDIPQSFFAMLIDELTTQFKLQQPDDFFNFSCGGRLSFKTPGYQKLQLQSKNNTSLAQALTCMERRNNPIIQQVPTISQVQPVEAIDSRPPADDFATQERLAVQLANTIDFPRYRHAINDRSSNATTLETSLDTLNSGLELQNLALQQELDLELANINDLNSARRDFLRKYSKEGLFAAHRSNSCWNLFHNTSTVGQINTRIKEIEHEDNDTIRNMNSLCQKA